MDLRHVLTSREEARRVFDVLHQYVRGQSEDRWYWRFRPPVPGGRGVYALNHESHAEQFRSFDDRGVAIRDYGGSMGRVSTPVRVAAYALAVWNAGALGGKPDPGHARFLRQAEFLAESLTRVAGVSGGLPYHVKWPAYDLPCPFFSSIAQGYGASVMLRAFHATGDDRWLEAARQAALFLEVGVERGGVARGLGGNRLFFEEAPNLDRPSLILNGHCVALLGLWELLEYDTSGKFAQLFQRGLAGLLHILRAYDVGLWSLYDLFDRAHPNWASVIYHNLHVVQLRILRECWGSAVAVDLERAWHKGLLRVDMRLLALTRKLLHKIARY